MSAGAEAPAMSSRAGRARRSALPGKLAVPDATRRLLEATELVDLHIHVGGAVAPHILWSIAHEQGFKLPGRRLLRVRGADHRPAGQGALPRGLPERHAHLDREDSVLAQAIERCVYEVIGKEYRCSRVTHIELRFNPMKRNLDGELDLDHIIHAALRGHGPGGARVRRAGRADLLPGPRVRPPPQRDHRRQGHQVPAAGAWWASTSPAPSETRSSSAGGGGRATRTSSSAPARRGSRPPSTPARPPAPAPRACRGGGEAQAAPHRPRHPRPPTTRRR